MESLSHPPIPPKGMPKKEGHMSNSSPRGCIVTCHLGRGSPGGEDQAARAVRPPLGCGGPFAGVSAQTLACYDSALCCLCFQHRRQLHYPVALISCPYSFLLCAHRWGSCRISFLLDLHRVLSCDGFFQPSPHSSSLSAPSGALGPP